MDDHLHLLVEAADERALARGMQGFSIRLAKGINRRMERSGRVFGDRYHSVILTSPKQVRRALAYVLQNAKRHAEQLCEVRRPVRRPSRRRARGCSWWAGGGTASSISRRCPVRAGDRRGRSGGRRAEAAPLSSAAHQAAPHGRSRGRSRGPWHSLRPAPRGMRIYRAKGRSRPQEHAGHPATAPLLASSAELIGEVVTIMRRGRARSRGSTPTPTDAEASRLTLAATPRNKSSAPPASRTT
jgi:hypothetical protein